MKHIFYIDKTDFIREWWEYADKVTLITRPRRFRKTLNMSMTECFFSNKYAALDDAGLGDQKQKVKRWYNGFTFGICTDIYNPWSIVSFINKRGKYDTYWSDTGGNGLVNQLIQKGTPNIKQTMEDLLRGKSFEAEIEKEIAFDQLNGGADAVWSVF